ncbi:MAG: hypothetical protein PHF86_12225 [Candidatus Nanoarchaeia archaeon]|nr:hypothetical protein [Candidatus Nanoarchaeia archaeon]
MLEFKAIPRKWGNSVGITLPNNIVSEGKIKNKKEIEVLIIEKKVNLKDIFGSLDLKEPTQKIKNDMKSGWS